MESVRFDVLEEEKNRRVAAEAAAERDKVEAVRQKVEDERMQKLRDAVHTAKLAADAEAERRRAELTALEARLKAPPRGRSPGAPEAQGPGAQGHWAPGH